MNIALVSPDTSSLLHRARGTGSYFENLKKALLLYDKKNNYIFPSKDKDVKNVDLVHYPYFEPFFIHLPIFKTRKIVVTVHDLTPLAFPEHFPSGLRGSLKWILQRKLLQQVDAIITDSECSKKDIIKYTGISAAKIHVIYLAAGEEFHKLNIENLKFKIAQKYGLPEAFALYVGDVTWNKNLPRLIEATKKAGIPLAMVGKALIEGNFDKKNPWNKDLLIAQELIKKSKNIKALGFVSQEELVTLYNLASVFVMPSTYEGFGLPVLEAMKCGCPVITSKQGSLPEVAGDAALYVDPYDIDSIAEGVGKLFNDDILRKKLSEKGLEQAKKFSWKKTAEETVKVYESV